MKKLFFGLTFLIILIIGGAYTLLFTAPGNSFVASMIESKVNEGQQDVNMKVNDFKLTMNDILFNATLDGNSTINVEGALNIFAKNVDLKYNLDIKDLSKLQNITKQKLNGPFSTNGTVKGDQQEAFVKGVSKVASGDTKYDVKLIDFKPSNILYTMKGVKIDELLYVLNQPKYATGLIDIDANIKNADIKNLDGKVLTNISKGKVNNAVVNKQFQQKLKQAIVFKGEIVTDLVKTQAISKVDMNTTVTNLDMAKAVFDIEKGEFVSDYTINFTSLAKLYDFTQTKMRGAAKFTGNIKQAAGLLKVDGKSNLFGGNINFNLLNNDFKAKVDGVEVKNLIHMLYYPEIFTSKSNIDVNYNLLTKVGKVDGNLLNGQFVRNEFSDIINTFAQFDLTKEVYEKVQINSDLNKDIIKTVVDMKSKHTTIKVPNSTLNTAKSTIDALVQAKILKYEFDTKVSGSLSDPKVKVDTKAFLKGKIGSKVKEKTDEIKKKAEDKIKEKLGDKIKLDGLNKLFQ